MLTHILSAASVCYSYPPPSDMNSRFPQTSSRCILKTKTFMREVFPQIILQDGIPFHQSPCSGAVTSYLSYAQVLHNLPYMQHIWDSATLAMKSTTWSSNYCLHSHAYWQPINLNISKYMCGPILRHHTAFSFHFSWPNKPCALRGVVYD